MFIGRQEELKFLEDRYHSDYGQLIVVYGRRRIGKTEILKHFCQEKHHVFYSCAENTDEQQLIAFSQRILSQEMEISRYIDHFSNWEQAFSSISQLPGTEKKLLIIDEFPYMVKGNRSIPSILQNLWDQKLKDQNIMIILCGSAMSFMEKEILAEKNPLYGRATGILKVCEMNFYDAVQFVPDYTAEDKIAVYGILGGIPHYLRQFDPQKNLKENICQNILTRGSILYSEVEFLMRQEFRETATYNAIITAVAMGSTRLNEISQKTMLEKSKLSAYIKNLMELEILEKEFPIGESAKEQGNVQRGLYQVSDPFFRFWYRYVFTNLSELENGDAWGIWTHVVEPDLNHFVSHAFEDVCRQYLRRQNREEKLPFYFTKIGRWWNKTDELDILAMDYSQSHVLLGECKYKNSPVSMADFLHMQRKFMPKKKDCQLYYYLFSKSGFDPALKALPAEPYVRLVDADEIVSAD